MTELALDRFDPLFKKTVTIQWIQKFFETTADGYMYMDYKNVQLDCLKSSLKLVRVPGFSSTLTE